MTANHNKWSRWWSTKATAKTSVSFHLSTKGYVFRYFKRGNLRREVFGTQSGSLLLGFAATTIHLGSLMCITKQRSQQHEQSLSHVSNYPALQHRSHLPITYSPRYKHSLPSLLPLLRGLVHKIRLLVKRDERRGRARGKEKWGDGTKEIGSSGKNDTPNFMRGTAWV